MRRTPRKVDRKTRPLSIDVAENTPSALYLKRDGLSGTLGDQAFTLATDVAGTVWVLDVGGRQFVLTAEAFVHAVEAQCLAAPAETAGAV